MAAGVHTLYRGHDPRELPNHGLTEAARYLRVPTSTLRNWALGTDTFKPIFEVAQRSPPTLSFFNLVEAHVLNAIRERLVMPKIRSALRYLRDHLGVERPLVSKTFQTDGVSLFVEHYGRLLNVSQQGQVAMRELLAGYLERIDFDPSGLAARLYPFTRPGVPSEDPRAVVFDPAVSFGRLILAGTGVTTSAVADRFAGGDTIDDLAADYRIDRRRVEEAIRCESLLRAA